MIVRIAINIEAKDGEVKIMSGGLSIPFPIGIHKINKDVA